MRIHLPLTALAATALLAACGSGPAPRPQAPPPPPSCIHGSIHPTHSFRGLFSPLKARTPLRFFFFSF